MVVDFATHGRGSGLECLFLCACFCFLLFLLFSAALVLQGIEA